MHLFLLTSETCPTFLERVKGFFFKVTGSFRKSYFFFPEKESGGWEYLGMVSCLYNAYLTYLLSLLSSFGNLQTSNSLQKEKRQQANDISSSSCKTIQILNIRN